MIKKAAVDVEGLDSEIVVFRCVACGMRLASKLSTMCICCGSEEILSSEEHVVIYSFDK